MTCYSYTNGSYIPNYKAKISINDRSVHFADAVYEVVTVFDYRMLFWSDHIKRLKKSLKMLDINYNKSFEALFYNCTELIKKNELQEGIIYIHISRGEAKRNHNWNKDLLPNLIISCLHKKTFSLHAKNISLISDADIRWNKCHIKTVSLLANVLLKQKAVNNNAFECLMVDKNGYVTEATTSNIWILKKKTLITTPLSSNILAGVTRKKVLELANTLNIRVLERKFKLKDVFNASGVFITNSSALILEANKLNTKRLKIDNSGLMSNLKQKMLELISNE
tara:strand:+ start:856 stop:1695 length:840 start_codon:yes stop_codon:yes gene_type:complete